MVGFPVGIRFVIAEDDDFLRETIAEVLALPGNTYTCVGKAKDGVEALDLVAKKQPDLLILDLRMPQMDGFAVMAALGNETKKPKILALSLFNCQTSMQRAFSLGADGYCNKTSGRSVLMEAVTRVINGKTYACPDH